MGMSMPYELRGRTQQKARTREALVNATSTLLAEGVTPTVEQAAAAAGISRTTAYRYFPNQRTLLVAAHPEIEKRSLLPDDAPADPEMRLAVAIRAATGIEALVWLTDVAGLSRREAAALMRWSARALLRCGLIEGPPSRSWRARLTKRGGGESPSLTDPGFAP